MIGTRLLDLIYTHDITQKQLAIDLNIAPSTLNGYINNRREPDYATLLQIAQYFAVTCDYLLGNDVKANGAPTLHIAKKELLLLKYFRRLDTGQKDLLIAQAKLMDYQNVKKPV